MNRHHAATIAVLSLGLAASPMAAAQQNAPPPSNAPSPAEKSPRPTTTSPDPKPGGGTAMPVPEKSLAPPAPAGSPPATSDKPPSLQTLVPAPADLGDVEDVTVPAKPAAILSGKAKKDQAVAELRTLFKRIDEDLAKAGIKPTGRPIAVFSNVDEDVLQFEAMIPIASAPAQAAAGSDGVRYGSTPSGKGFRYRHSGSYDAIDNTYGILSTYFDMKDLVVQDMFVEEYVTDLVDGADDKLEVNIYALRK